MKFWQKKTSHFWEVLIANGRSDRIRTYDPLVPSQVLYQTELRPESNFVSHQQKTQASYIKLLLSKNGATGGIRTPDPRLRRPLLYPTELQTRKVVGATGFEPTTPWSQARCSTKLSYAPTTQEILCHIFQTLSSIFLLFSKSVFSSFLHNIDNYNSIISKMQAFIQ